MNEIESLMTRYNSYEGVEKILIIHSVKSEDTINSAVMKKIYKVKDDKEKEKEDLYCKLIPRIANDVDEMIKINDQKNELTFIRIKTTNHELLIAPNNNHFFCVLQNLTSES